ncbi:hypothetical protein [Rickettsia endosymbiont of Halotydeus destructor]|uniref:hypothetical protein n=1 Tax=Rickettsia endosymbiont of Halotydeus destructor TaxID=2996754 RepID=UPI003BAE99CA
MKNNGNASDFLEAAKKLKSQVMGDDVAFTASDFRDAAEELKTKTFAENISTDIDNFVEQHFNKPIEKNELENFFNTLLDKCVENNLVTAKAREEYKKPKDNIGNKVKGFFGMEKEVSKFEEIVQIASGLLKDTAPNLSLKDKLFYNVAQFCEDLGLKSLGKICKNQISSDN